MLTISGKIKQRINKFKTKLHTDFLIDYPANWKNTVFLAGSGRSGTTWLSDIINYNNEYRYIFEPFWSNKIEICKDFNPRQYIRPGNKEKRFLKPTEAILSGKVKNEWTDKFNQKFISDKRLIKDIRVNLFLRWLYESFPSMPIIIILRHPCAVAASKSKLNWTFSLNNYLVQEELIIDFLSRFRLEIEDSQKRYESTGDNFENSIFHWCIENYVLLKQFDFNEIHLIFYEELCTNPEHEVQKLFSYLNKEYNNDIFNIISKASKLSRGDSAILSGESLIDSWRKHLTTEQLQKANEILNLFGLNKIYSQDAMPHTQNIYQVMKA